MSKLIIIIIEIILLMSVFLFGVVVERKIHPRLINTVTLQHDCKVLGGKMGYDYATDFSTGSTTQIRCTIEKDNWQDDWVLE
jgi:hypothetical protein